MTKSTSDYDSPWKEALDVYFQDFLRLVDPWVHAQIDWMHVPVFLDKELQALAWRGQRGRLYADKLVQVVGKHQQPLCILVHVEVQGGRMTPLRQAAFGRRILRYAWRIEERYFRGAARTRYLGGAADTHPSGAAVGSSGVPKPEDLISLGVLTDSAGGDTHLTYSWGRPQANSGWFRFRVVHLAAWLERGEELEREAKVNPFAVVIMAQLQAQATRKQSQQRLASKTHIVGLLHH